MNGTLFYILSLLCVMPIQIEIFTWEFDSLYKSVIKIVIYENYKSIVSPFAVIVEFRATERIPSLVIHSNDLEWKWYSQL